ncbi:membrane-spanning 4-domains subfamily A member 4A-like [Lampris incognitus]|uniref:membrane-spanning 4-domains subfamily A member 4A-like n=1 Tax=Lampris incognitus TaxID=2546036 RepID=UPI0024B60F97|nr:membrane-spanning 4-domains subfamily A member 4A-like [Lampris incognitus]
MSSSVTTATNGLVVITHVFPPGSGSPNQQVVYADSSDSSAIQTFRRFRPLALGTVQILVGAVVLLFGVVMVFSGLSLGVYSGVFVWGAIIYIIAGSLTVATGKSSNKCLVSGALGMNVAGAVASFTAFIMYCLDATGLFIHYCYDSGSWNWACDQYMIQYQGVSSVLAFFALLQFIVSVCVAAFACRAKCCSEPKPHVVINPFAEAGTHTVATHNETQVNAQTCSRMTNLTAADVDGEPPHYNNIPETKISYS